MNQTALRVGDELCFEYPAANYLHARPRWERRWLRVDEVHEGPPPQEAIDRDPLLNRAGALVVGRDFTRNGAVRSFYIGAARCLEIVANSLGGGAGTGYAAECEPLPSCSQGGMESQAPSPVKAAEEGADVMESRLYVRREDGSTFVRAWKSGDLVLYPVRFTSHLTGRTAIVGEYGDRNEAIEAAELLGPCAAIEPPVSLCGA